MRLVASAFCALLITALCVAGMRWLEASEAQGDGKLTVLKGRVATPATPCRGTARSSTFMLMIDVAGTYQSYRFVCDEVVRMAAVGGAEVVFGAEAVSRGNQDAWLVRTAKVDGRNLFEPRNFFAPPSDGEIYFLLSGGVFLFLLIGAFAVPGERPRNAVPHSKRKRK
jgi:hypothetical protein